jgi:outer membrane protein assembly factor BamD
VPRSLPIALCIVGLLAGCAPAASGTTDPGELVKRAYLAGMESMKDGDYEEAIGLFKRVMRVPGYVRLAANARLRIGDALFLQDKYEQAITTYRTFLREYEGDENAGYAYFRIGHAYYQQIPGDWFLAPPRYERQQSAVQQAAAALRQFVRLYPTHALAQQGQAMLDECQQQLYEHEAYVARFHFERNKPAGVVQRLERAFDRYPEHASTEDNFLMLAKAYVETDRVSAARSMYRAYLDRFPAGEHRATASESLSLLEQLEKRESDPPRPAPAPESNPDSGEP